MQATPCKINPLQENSIMNNLQPVLAVSTGEAARLLGISERRLRELTLKGKIKARRVGVRVLFSIKELETFLASEDVATVAPPNGYLTIAETARLFCCSIAVVDSLINHGKIVAVNIDANQFIPFCSVRHLMLAVPSREAVPKSISDMAHYDVSLPNSVVPTIFFHGNDFLIHETSKFF